jgi:DNA-binding SARP family transcriptional activator/ABC-type glycerol-3-phosphate transport system substrate-binding protein/energy-coupling factor transporter ATP-binding protein EcfA2
MDFRILGPLEVDDEGAPIPLGGRRQRTVLAALLVNANETVSTDRLVDQVWGEDPPETARRSLQAYVSRLRKLIGEERISAIAPGYRLQVDPEEADWERFTEQVRVGKETRRTDPRQSAGLLREALRIWRGAPFADLADEHCLQPVIARLEDQRLAALEERIEADLQSGHHGTLVGELESLIGRHPLRERLRGQLMLALYRSGRQAEALRAFQQARTYLGQELGVEPSPELQNLEEQILDQDSNLDFAGEIRVVEGPAGDNPYKGLRAFGEEDAGVFYGRERLVEVLVDRVAEARFLAVIGPSGCGKSSVVRAGLIPALRSGAVSGSEHWRLATMVPGAHPFEELEAALIHGCDPGVTSLREQFRGDHLDLLRAVLRVSRDDEVVLVIDQFEELFLLVHAETERRRFIRNVIEALEDPHSRLRVIVTLRADFYDLPLRYSGLASWIGDHQVTVPPLGPAELERAAVRPATEAGVGFELDLAAELVSDVAQQPSALPLFQYTLTELFDRRVGPTLTLDTYRSFGGLNGALRNRAEELFRSLDGAEQATTRQLFLRLVALGEEAEDTRRRLRMNQLTDLDMSAAGTVSAVLDRFGSHRLLTFDRDPASGEPTVELAHEALLSEWPRLRGWIDESREGLRMQRTLASETAEWEAADRNADYLLTGTRLALFEQWSAETDLHLTPVEQAFLDTSINQRASREAAEATRREREIELERRSVSRLRRLVGVLAVAVIAAAGLTAYAVNEGREADRLAAEEQAQRILAQEERATAELNAARVTAAELTAASVASLNEDPQLGLLLALHAVDIMTILEEPIPVDTVAALHWAIQASRIPYPMDTKPGVAISGPNGLQGIYNLPLDDLVALAQSGITRSLSEDESERFLGADETGPLRDVFPPLQIAGPLVGPVNDPARPLAGTRIDLMGGFLAEIPGIRAEAARFTEETGIEVTYFGLADLEGILPTLGPGNVPDLAFLPQPGYVMAAAGDGALIDLSMYLDPVEMEQDYSPYLVRLLTRGDDGSWPAESGSLYGIPLKLSVKSLIWYPALEFEQARYEIPETWSDLVTLSDQIVADGRTPWCWGESAWEPAAGWPATDWIEDIILHESGTERYDRWVFGDLPFQSPEIRSAFEHLGEVVFNEEYVGGGLEKIMVPYTLADDPMFLDPPECWLYRQASFAPADFPPTVVPGIDVRTFPFPLMGARTEEVVLGGGDFVVAFRDRPEVRELVRYFNRPDFGLAWTKTIPGFLSAHREYEIGNYADPESQQLGAQIAAALEVDAFRFDGSDLMPNGGFWMYAGMVDYLEGGPESLDEVLANLDDPDWRYLHGYGEEPEG